MQGIIYAIKNKELNMKKRIIKTGIVFLLLFPLLYGCPPPDPGHQDPESPPEYEFIKSLVNDSSGMVDSSKANHNTTVYKNALAAMAFIHQGDYDLAEGVFGFFQDRYLMDPPAFAGFHQWWDSETGLPDAGSDRWEGDNAFLLLALNYYSDSTGNGPDYADLTAGLKDWLVLRGNHDPSWYPANNLNADGLSDMYAALLPYESEGGDIPAALANIKTGFFNDYTGTTVLDHLNRAAQVFGYVNDFKAENLAANFERTETWQYDTEVTMNAYAAFSGEDFINLEISAQILNSHVLWEDDLELDLSGLREELEKAWIETGDSRGLPYLLTYVPGPGGHGWDGCYDDPLVDPGCYMLYAEWGFNPFAPGRQSAEYVSAAETIQSELCYDSEGVQINPGDISDIDGGDLICYRKIDFGDGTLTAFRAHVCKGNSTAGQMEIRLDAADGILAGTFTPSQTCDDWGTWEEQTASPVSAPAGTHDVYLVFAGGTGICNLDWMVFE